MGEKWKNLPFLGRTAHWYWYRKWLLIPIHQRGIGTDIEQGGTCTGASNNPVFVPLSLLSLVFVHRLFRDPNKGLLGIHIRVYKRENVPYLAAEAKCDNCLPTKSGVFMFD